MNRSDSDLANSELPFLLEIGSEEIPARFVPDTLRDLAQRLEAMLSESGLAYGSLRTLATPRRLAVLVQDLVAKQPDRELAVKGPPVAAAFDDQGNPTQAALGFVRKHGVEIADCGRVSDARGEYLLVRKTVTGRSAAEVLAEQLPTIISAISFRKVMRWGAGDFEYARPLQWLVALLGEEVIAFETAGLAAGRTTRGHRTLAEDRQREIPRPEAYVATLRELSVIVDHEERRELIVAGVERAMADLPVTGTWLRDEELLTEIVFLCEYPTPFVGLFEEEYFALPDEVIVTALKAHQRYFAVGHGDGSGLLPYFISVRDGGDHALDRVVDGNQRVLRARLADALFYWHFDQKKNSDEHTAELATVTWIDGFGSVLDKTRRLQKLVGVLWERGLGDGTPPPAALVRAAAICKSDQVSEMIKDGKEFTKLEGLIGARYAAQAGESPEVCRALERYYYPKSAGGPLPGDRISSVLSVADRLDTLTGCWLAGFVPTGAKDPYALRRHSLALLRMLLDLEARIDLRDLLTVALAGFDAVRGDRDPEAAADELAAFIQTRLAGLLTDVRDCTPEVVRAILPAHGNDPTDAVAWIEALEVFREREDFLLLATGFKRCKNILEGELIAPDERAASLERWLAGGSGARGETFADLTEDAERTLLTEIAAAVPALREAESAGAYDTVFQHLSGFGPAIDVFFDTVRVNVREPDLKRVRHGFLREIHALFARYAEFSEVAPLDR